MAKVLGGLRRGWTISCSDTGACGWMGTRPSWLYAEGCIQEAACYSEGTIRFSLEEEHAGCSVGRKEKRTGRWGGGRETLGVW